MNCTPKIEYLNKSKKLMECSFIRKNNNTDILAVMVTFSALSIKDFNFNRRQLQHKTIIGYADNKLIKIIYSNYYH